MERVRFSPAALTEVTRRDAPLPEFDAIEEDGAALTQIQDEFARKLMALRRLPRRERPHALKAAREMRRVALKALRDKRATERHSQRVRRRSHIPTPS